MAPKPEALTPLPSKAPDGPDKHLGDSLARCHRLILDFCHATGDPHAHTLRLCGQQLPQQSQTQNPLIPADPFAAAKVRELALFLDLHLELVARNLYPEAFFGGKVSDSVKEKVGAQLEKSVAAFAKLAKFSPFIAGDSLSLADCAAVTHLPLVSGATKLIYGKDFLAELPVRDYLKMMGERPHMQTVNADRKANMELMMSRMKAKS